MVGFTWALTTFLTIFAFLAAIFLVIEIHTHYRHLERYYESDDWLQNYQYKNNGGNQGADDNDYDDDGGEDSRDYEDAQNVQYQHLLLASMSTKSIAWVALYVMLLATGLSLYGSTAIVGFTSLRGVYIAPCFSSGSDKLRMGIFGGAVVLFANLLLVCAVILGEIRVDDNREQREGENGDESEPYRVERIAAVLAVTCMFLSALYTIFAVLLFLCYAGDEAPIAETSRRRPSKHSTPLVSVNDGEGPALDRPGFITMDNST
jgi:predicted RND superfamily exporter protein